MKIGKKTKSYARMLLGLTLLTFLILYIDFNELLKVIRDIDIKWLLVMLVLPHIALYISVVKWKWLLNALDIEAGSWPLYKLYLIGTFFNNFLPSMVGGDVVRAYLLKRDGNDLSSIAAATLLERLTGLAALMTCLPIVVFDHVIVSTLSWLPTAVVLVVLGFVCSIFLMVNTDKFGPFKKIKKRYPDNKVINFLKNTKTKVNFYNHHKTTLFICYLISFLFYFLAVLTVYSATRAIGAHLELSVLLIIVPIVLVIGLLPITVNGLGTSETSWVYFMGLYGILHVNGLVIGLLLRSRLILTSIIGGVFYSFVKKQVT